MKLKGCLHVHTWRSIDGYLPAQLVVNAYEEAGYDFIAITDHFRWWDKSATAKEMVILNGQEISPDLYPFHHVGEVSYKEKRRWWEWIPWWPRRKGVFRILNHPQSAYGWDTVSVELYRRSAFPSISLFVSSWNIGGEPVAKRLSVKEINQMLLDEAYRLDAVEISYIGIVCPEYWQAYENGQFVKPVVVTDDLHTLADLGRAWIEIEAEAKTELAIIQALKAGRIECQVKQSRAML